MTKLLQWARGLMLPVALLGCAPADFQPRAASSGSPNVVLIVVDALRQDHLHLYGYERTTSNRIDALGRSGWVFKNHVASASQTVPSTLSLLLSQHPAEHGFLHERPGQFTQEPPLYPESFLFLSEVFHQAGYTTGGFVGNPFLDERNGFHQGFDEFVNSRRDEKLTGASRRWLRQVTDTRATKPFFLYLHYMGVHSPYEPPRKFQRFPAPEGGQLVYRNGPMPDVSPRDLAFTKSRYDGGIAFVDHQIGLILDELLSRGQLENTIVAVTSDHGDEFLEHGGLGHGTHVYGELVRVPLIISFAKTLEPGRRIDHLTRHLDLAPTLLEMAGLEKPGSFRGHSLRQAARHAFAENGPWRAVYTEEGKLVVNRETGEAALFGSSDGLDLHPLSLEPGESEMWADLEAYRRLKERFKDRRGDTVRPEPWQEEELKHLQSLGYVVD